MSSKEECKVLVKIAVTKAGSRYNLALALGVHYRTIGSWERGDQAPSKDNMSKVKAYLCLT